jgi:hypothetical protein
MCFSQKIILNEYLVFNYRTLIKGQFAPSEQKIEQTLSSAREEKVTIVLFFGNGWDTINKFVPTSIPIISSDG